jgi:hypothetical protein
MNNTTVPERLVRSCSNIKSRKSPDVPCKLSATHGDYCSRHWKHPTRYLVLVSETSYSNKKFLIAARTIQKFWRSQLLTKLLKYHGPGIISKERSCNREEIYSLDPVEQIPRMFLFSYVDSKRNLWIFDIRSLGQLLSMGELKYNPYTREPFQKLFMDNVIHRLTWLRNRKYSVLHPTGIEMTAEQIWRQRILDVCMKIESFGYYVSCDWYTTMTIQDHQEFYRKLYTMWFATLGLSNEQRESIVPGYMSSEGRLFRYSPDTLETQRGRSKIWWEKINLGIMEALLTRSQSRESNKLGAMYCVIGFVSINEKAAEVFPWFSDVV